MAADHVSENALFTFEQREKTRLDIYFRLNIHLHFGE